MRISRTLLTFTLASLFAGCQVYTGKPVDPESQQSRLQGHLTEEDKQLWFTPCHETRRFVMAAGATSLAEDSRDLLRSQHGPLFADVRGVLGASHIAGSDGQITLSHLYRLQPGQQLCGDPNFKQTLLHAAGHQPFWTLDLTHQGMLLSGAEKQPLALPYLEEQLPDNRLSFTSEANGQHLELWITPQRCLDSATGTVSHLSAELRLNGKLLRGCAWFGGARNR
jgi:putative lipoprotein